jgi:DNA-binding NtrC family response regulator
VLVVSGPDQGQSARAEDETLTIGSADDNDLVLRGDPLVSRFHVQLRRVERGILVSDLASTNGTFAGPVEIHRATVGPGTTLQVGHTTLHLRDGAEHQVELHPETAIRPLRGGSVPMRRLFHRIAKAAGVPLPILVLGESGTGKELIAEAIHELSDRSDHPMVTVDCGMLTPSLVASELFGHERGAFTDAHRRHEGAFERGHLGTVFLDEVGELPPNMQVALLGVLERKKFRRVGGSEDIRADVRIIAATNRDRRSEVNGGTFRLDLYHRLAGIVLEVPPLRERPEDIPLLVEHFLRQAGHDGPVDEMISSNAMAQLQTHRWPGNARELRNVVEVALSLGEPPYIGETPMRPGVAEDPIERLLGLPYRRARSALLDVFERRYVEQALDQSGGNVALAARKAGMNRTYLFDLIRRHDLRQ